MQTLGIPQPKYELDGNNIIDSVVESIIEKGGRYAYCWSFLELNNKGTKILIVGYQDFPDNKSVYSIIIGNEKIYSNVKYESFLSSKPPDEEKFEKVKRNTGIEMNMKEVISRGIILIGPGAPYATIFSKEQKKISILDDLTPENTDKLEKFMYSY